jgi:hypothetical protein
VPCANLFKISKAGRMGKLRVCAYVCVRVCVCKCVCKCVCVCVACVCTLAVCETRMLNACCKRACCLWWGAAYLLFRLSKFGLHPST